MTYLRPLAANFNDYPRTMIRLCATAYGDRARVAADAGGLGWQVVWGPVEQIDESGVSRNLTYIARRDTPLEYTVVMRGMTPYRLESWFMESGTITMKQPFKRLAPHAPDDAHISQGAFDTLAELLETADPESGRTIVEFLREIPPAAYLYVTGHGGGGTLVAPMFAYLNDQLYGGGYVGNMAPFSFAGHTSGDIDFSLYFNSLFNPRFPWRIYNSLDIAPLCWHSFPQVRDIYEPYGLLWEPEESKAIEAIFDGTLGRGYSHPTGSKALYGIFDGSDKKTWFEQAIHQHHASTYKLLVDIAFPAQ